MIRSDQILGDIAQPEWHRKLHAHDHAGTAEWITLPRRELARRRIRTRTNAGTDVAIALPRTTALFDGAVIHHAADRIFVVRMEAEEWLRLRPRSPADALRLGYCAGNLHWRATFDGTDLMVAVETKRQDYLDRLAEQLDTGVVALVTSAPETAGEKP